MASPWPQAPALTLLADLDNDGVFETDFSAYLLHADVDIKRERALDAFSPRAALFTLDNEDSRFSARNTGSPYYPNLKKGRKVQFQASLVMDEVTNLSENPSAEYDIEGNIAASGGGTLVRDPQGFIDDFDIDSSSLYTAGGDVAATWTWEPASSRLKVVGGTQATLVRNGLSLQDVEIEIEIEQAYDAGILFRYVDNNNHYKLLVRDNVPLANTLVLQKRVAGVSSNIVPPVRLTWAPGVRHRIRVSAEGPSLKVYWDDALVISTTDATFEAAGGVGLRHDGAAQTSYFHRVEVSPARSDTAIKPYLRSAKSGGVSTSVSSKTVSYTVGSQESRLLRVVTSSDDPAGNYASGVTYNGVAMTLLAQATRNTLRQSVWYLINPPAGTHDVVATWPDVQSKVGVGIEDYYYVDQATPWGTPATAVGTSTSPSLTINSASDELVVDSISLLDTTAPIDDEGSSLWVVNVAFFSGAASIEAGAPTVTTSWTTPNSDWVLISASLKVDTAAAIAGISLLAAAGAAAARYGKASVKTTTVNADESGVLHYTRDGTTRFAVTAGVSYAAQVSVTADTADRAMELVVAWYNAGGALISTDAIAFTPGVDDLGWSEVSRVATAPATAVTAILGVRTVGAQGVFNFWCDGWALYAADAVEPYCDGDQGGSEWLPVAGLGPAAPHMGSQSFREANPTVTKFTGAMREFGLQRGMDDKEFGLVCSGDVERFVNTPISAGPFAAAGASSKMRPSWVYNRLLDLLEKGEVITDTGVRAWGGGWANVGATVTRRTTRYVEAMEADAFMYIEMLAPVGAGSGARLDVTSLIADGASARFAVFLGPYDEPNLAVAAAAGLNAKVQLRDTTGVVTSKIVALGATIYDWLYVEIEGTYNAGAANRYVEILADGAGWGSTDYGWKFASYHLGPSLNHAPRVMRGNFWDSVNIEYLSGYNKSGQVLLDDLLKAVGAWLIEDGDGNLIAEDFSTRWPNKRPLVRLSDALDGFGYATGGYRENATGLYNVPRVGSYGELKQYGSGTLIAWGADADVVLSANERRVLRVPLLADGQSTLVAAFLSVFIRAVTVGSLTTDPLMGNKATPYAMNFGDVAEIVLVAGASGATVKNVRAASGGSATFNKDGTFPSMGAFREGDEVIYLEYDARDDPDSDDMRVLPLEMPAQGYKTELMDLLAHWAGAKYKDGPAMLDVTFSGSTLAKMLEVFFREPGDAVWLKHKTGQGAFYLDDLFFIEGMKFSFAPGDVPKAVWHLEEA